MDETYPDYHGTENRGVKAVVLKGPAQQKFLLTSEMETWDVMRDNIVVPSYTDTTYLCKIIKIPQDMLDEKHHVVAVSTEIFGFNGIVFNGIPGLTEYF